MATAHRNVLKQKIICINVYVCAFLSMYMLRTLYTLLLSELLRHLSRTSRASTTRPKYRQVNRCTISSLTTLNSQASRDCYTMFFLQSPRRGMHHWTLKRFPHLHANGTVRKLCQQPQPANAERPDVIVAHVELNRRYTSRVITGTHRTPEKRGLSSGLGVTNCASPPPHR